MVGRCVLSQDLRLQHCPETGTCCEHAPLGSAPVGAHPRKVGSLCEQVACGHAPWEAHPGQGLRVSGCVAKPRNAQ